MDFELSEEQRLLRTVTKDFFKENCPSSHVRAMEQDPRGFSNELWGHIASLGWLGLPFPEKYSGSGGTFLDMAVILEEMGRAAYPSPYVSTVVLAGMSILDAGSEAQKSELLSAIAEGNCFATLAITEAGASYRPESVAANALRCEGGYRISGEKLFVTDAHVADLVICAARIDGTDGVSLFLVRTPAEGISIERLETIGAERQCRINLDNVFVSSQDILGRPGGADGVIQRAVSRGALATCIEQIGGCQTAFDLTVEYVKQRVAFGQPIGKFQAVQHHVANMYMDLDAMRFLAYEAAWRYSSGMPCEQEISAAKAWTAAAAPRLTRTAAQVHGGIGLTMDYDLQLYFRRAKGAEPLYGGGAVHLRKVADGLNL